MKEIWKAIPGFDGYYLASNIGRIKSVARVASNGNILKEGIKKQRINKGYPKVSIGYNGIKKTYSVHRLVALSFIGLPKKDQQINHKNGNKMDNCIKNLEWVSSSQNVKHSYDTGLKKQYFGDKHYMAVPVLQYSKDGKFIKMWGCQRDACREFNMNPASLHSCLVGKSKSSAGFHWKYL